jgi:hypothetical protein
MSPDRFREEWAGDGARARAGDLVAILDDKPGSPKTPGSGRVKGKPPRIPDDIRALCRAAQRSTPSSDDRRTLDRERDGNAF